MVVFKCKMCGGEMSLEEGATVAECPYCLTKQTLPKLDNEKRTYLYDRANHFRRQNDLAANRDAGAGQNVADFREIGELFIVNNLNRLKTRTVIHFQKADGFGGTVGANPAF